MARRWGRDWGGARFAAGLAAAIGLAATLGAPVPVSAFTDPDGDGLSTPDPEEDADADGVANAAELARGTNPLDADSDDDGIRDGDEPVQTADAPVLPGAPGCTVLPADNHRGRGPLPVSLRPQLLPHRAGDAGIHEVRQIWPIAGGSRPETAIPGVLPGAPLRF